MNDDDLGHTPGDPRPAPGPCEGPPADVVGIGLDGTGRDPHEIPWELSMWVPSPHTPLSRTVLNGAGLHGNNLDGDPRYPHTWAKLTPVERRRLWDFVGVDRDGTTQDDDKIPWELSILVLGPHHQLSHDVVEGIGLDGNGFDGNPRWPYTWAKLTPAERQRLRAFGSENPDAL